MPLRLPDLVGRAMVDPEFLSRLQRAPESILAEYELSEEERAAIRTAVARLADTPLAQQAHALRAALLRRLAT